VSLIFCRLSREAPSPELQFLARVADVRGMTIDRLSSLSRKKPEVLLEFFYGSPKPTISQKKMAELLGVQDLYLRASRSVTGSFLNMGDLDILQRQAITACRACRRFGSSAEANATKIDLILREKAKLRRLALRAFLGVTLPLLGPTIEASQSEWGADFPEVYVIARLLRERKIVDLLTPAMTRLDEAARF
jgi:hypothetical protein